MKSTVLIGLALVASFIFGGCCTTQVVEYKSKIYVPVYKNLDEIRSGIKKSEPRKLSNTGKIYFYGKYILVNEKQEGIHIIDNSNPSSPQNIAFLEIPGNGDMAVKNNILYADSYIDFVAIDISQPASPQLVKRIEGIFPNRLDNSSGSYVDPEKGLLVEYIEKDTIFKYTINDCDDNSTSPVYYGRGGLVDFNEGASKDGGTTNNSNGSTGKGGSMARFTIYVNHLYSVDGTSLQIFDISQAQNPRAWAKQNIGWQIETIYPFKNRLFIGSTTGMFVYDVSNPAQPKQIGQFQHARACDPVVADDKYAYVTLRSNTRCTGFANQLDVIDISDLSNPKLLKSYPMQEPAGLGLDGNTLFICDGPAGLKVFDVTNPLDMQLIDWESDLKTFDVIPLGESLLMIGDDGLFQYNYSDPKNLMLLSKIPIVKK